MSTMRLRIKIGSRKLWWPVLDTKVSVESLVEDFMVKTEQPPSKWTVMVDDSEVLGSFTVDQILRDGEVIELVGTEQKVPSLLSTPASIPNPATSERSVKKLIVRPDQGTKRTQSRNRRRSMQRALKNQALSHEESQSSDRAVKRQRLEDKSDTRIKNTQGADLSKNRGRNLADSEASSSDSSDSSSAESSDSSSDSNSDSSSDDSSEESSDDSSNESTSSAPSETHYLSELTTDPSVMSSVHNSIQLSLEYDKDSQLPFRTYKNLRLESIETVNPGTFQLTVPQPLFDKSSVNNRVPEDRPKYQFPFDTTFYKSSLVSLDDLTSLVKGQVIRLSVLVSRPPSYMPSQIKNACALVIEDYDADARQLDLQLSSQFVEPEPVIDMYQSGAPKYDYGYISISPGQATDVQVYNDAPILVQYRSTWFEAILDEDH